MASQQPSLRQAREPHAHVLSEFCPVCDQPISNEKAQEIRTKFEEHKRSLAEAADARATKEIAAAVEKFRKENEEALKKANADAVTKAEAARIEGRKAAEDASEAKIAAAEHGKQKALDELRTFKEEQEAVVSKRVEEAREALERERADALSAVKAAHDAETQKLSSKLETLQRQIDKQRAEELGEGAHIKLLDVLRSAFKGDHIESIERGVPGADILHTILHNGRECGKIVYESKNSTVWRNDYVAKLVRDQTAAKADFAVLSTFKFPAGGAQVLVSDGVIVVNPARAVVIAEIVRHHIVATSALRLSREGRVKKMALLYELITSPRCAHLLSRIESHTDSLLKLQEKEIKAHQTHWKSEGQLYQSIHKARSDLQTEIDLIVGADDSRDEGDDNAA